MKIPALKKDGILTVCFYPEFEPVIYGTGQGFEADLLRAVCSQWNIRIKFVPEHNYHDIWLKVSEKNSPFDVVAGGIDPNCRPVDPKVIYSLPTARYSQSLLVRRHDFQNKKVIGWESFVNSSMKIGLVGNTTGEIYAHKIAKENNLSKSIFIRYEDESHLIPALLGGEIVAIARGTIGNEYQEYRNQEFITIAKRSFGEVLAFPVDPNNEELYAALNHTLKFITDDFNISYADWFKDQQVFAKRIAR